MSKYALIVNEDPTVENAVREHTRSVGIRTVWASSPEEALKKASENPPAVVVLDLMSPRTRGLALLRRLKAEGHPANRAPIIGHVSHTMHELKTRAHDLGCDFVFTRSVLAKQIGSILRELGVTAATPVSKPPKDT